MSLNSLRASPSFWGQKPTDDAIQAIQAGWTATMVGQYEQRLEDGKAKFKVRRERAREVNSVLENEFDGLVSNLLASRYHKDTYVKLILNNLGISTRVNVLRDVLDKADVTVAEGCDYSLVDVKLAKTKRPILALEDDNPPAFDAMIEKAGFDAILQRVSRLCWVHPAVAVGPKVVWSDRIGKRVIEMCVLTPDRFDLIGLSEDSAVWDVIVVYCCDAEGKDTERTLWSSTGYTEQVWNKDLGKWQTEETGPNPYGQIPFVVFKPVDSQRWWNENYGRQLVEATKHANAAETFIDYLMSGQVKIPFGSFEDMPAGQTLLHGNPVKGGLNATGTQMWDLQLDIDRLISNYITRERTQAAQAMGLSGGEWDTSSTPPSGTALQMKFWARDKGAIARRTWLIPKSKELFRVYLRVLWEEIKAVLPGTVDGVSVVQTWPVDGFDGGWVDGKVWAGVDPKAVLPPYDENTSADMQTYQIRIDPRDVSYPISIDDQIKDEEYRLAKGFTSPSKLLRERDPNVSLADAPKEIEDNLKETERFKKLKSPGSDFPIGGSEKMTLAALDPALEPGAAPVVPATTPPPPAMGGK